VPAVLALHRLGVDDGRELLFSRYEAGNLAPFEQTALLQALAEMGDTRVLPVLIGYAGRGDFGRRITALAVLANYRLPAARAALLEVTKDSDGNLRREAWHSLWLSGYTEALEQLHLMLRDDDDANRRIAATLLGEIVQRESAEHLAGALEHETVRGVAMQLAIALGKIGVPETAGADVRANARDPESRPSQAILTNNLASALLLYEEIDEDARDALAKLSESGNAAHRMNAMRALMRHGKGPASRKAILAGLGDEASGVREFAARAWLRFPGADVAPLVRAYEKETDAALARTMADLATRLVNRWGE
jgi:HEAT repeat protein